MKALAKISGVIAVPEADCSTEDCSLALYMGSVGDDRNGNAFQTGYQISQVNQYAVSTLYNNIVQQVNLPAHEPGQIISVAFHAQTSTLQSAWHWCSRVFKHTGRHAPAQQYLCGYIYAPILSERNPAPEKPCSEDYSPWRAGHKCAE